MINNSYQEIEVRPVHWKCSLPLGLIYTAVFRNEDNDLKSLCVIKCEARTANNQHSSWIPPTAWGLLTQQAPHVKWSKWQKESGSRIFPLLHVSPQDSMQVTYGKLEWLYFQATFPSEAMHTLFIKYQLYATPVLSTGNIEMTKTEPLPWKNSVLGGEQRLQSANCCVLGQTHPEEINQVQEVLSKLWLTTGEGSIQKWWLKASQRLIQSCWTDEIVGRQFIKI